MSVGLAQARPNYCTNVRVYFFSTQLVLLLFLLLLLLFLLFLLLFLIISFLLASPPASSFPSLSLAASLSPQYPW